jgi:hypothetical protein
LSHEGWGYKEFAAISISKSLQRALQGMEIIYINDALIIRNRLRLSPLVLWPQTGFLHQPLVVMVRGRLFLANTRILRSPFFFSSSSSFYSFLFFFVPALKISPCFDFSMRNADRVIMLRYSMNIKESMYVGLTFGNSVVGLTQVEECFCYLLGN